jgi:hypothetical protein
MLVWSNIISKAKAKAKAAAAKVVIAQNHQGWDAVRGRVETATGRRAVFWHAKPRAISLKTDGSIHGGCETNTHAAYNAFIGWDHGNNIAHYGVPAWRNLDGRRGVTQIANSSSHHGSSPSQYRPLTLPTSPHLFCYLNRLMW